MGHSARIVICPLDWGLGHATRDIPLIRELLDAGHEVILAAGGSSLELLEREFPELESIFFGSSLKIRYSRKIPAWLKITFLSPLLLFEILAEHRRMSALAGRLEPDIIISDNRYGVWQPGIRSILITHQASIRAPGILRFMDRPLSRFLRYLISRFDECWIPDYPGERNLAGRLCHRWQLPPSFRFIGPLSRFSYSSSASRDSGQGKPVRFTGAGVIVTGPDLLVLLSGPEPQRSQLQKIILKQIFLLQLRCVILKGVPGKIKREDLTSTVSIYNHLPGRELERLIGLSRMVICRAGYTSIMELAALRKKALLVPTPGQTEQEYLADYLSGRGMFRTCSQYEFDLESAVEDLEAFEPRFDLPDDKKSGPVVPDLLRQTEA